MPLPKPNFKSVFSRKKKKAETPAGDGSQVTESGTEMTGLGLSYDQSARRVPGPGEAFTPHQTPHLQADFSRVHYTDSASQPGQNVKSAGASVGQGAAYVCCQSGARESPNTHPVRPPRATDTSKSPHTVAGVVNPNRPPFQSLTSDYGTISERSSMVSSVSDLGDGDGSPSDSGAGSGVCDKPTVTSSLFHVASVSQEGITQPAGRIDSVNDISTSMTSCLLSPSTGEESMSLSPISSNSTVLITRPAAMEAAGPSQSLCPVSASVVCQAQSMPASGTASGVVCEMFPQSALSTPVGALRKSRNRLCLMLNIPQDPVENHLPPDYTGLAELLDFDVIEIENFGLQRSPAEDLIRTWARCQEKKPFLWNLIGHLQTLGREDILEDCCGLILEDVADYIAEQNLLQYYTVNRLSSFDCYVNIADEDLTTIGREILDTLEGVYGLRLCLTLRDVAVGSWQFDEMATMLETRCHSKVLIVMSRYYEYSDACQFLTQFAVTLDPGARRNKLIPLLVDEGVAIPRSLRCLAMLNYHRDRRLGFLWPRLCTAIKSN